MLLFLSLHDGHTIPLGFYKMCPVSVSLIAWLGNDCFLLGTLQTMYSTLQELVDIAAKSKSPRNAVTREECAEIAKEKIFLHYIR
ncbi:hypothetical protein Ahy_A05g022231 isoform C [Arachis hypogaea]|uniref:Uncharacterized protein n=1 Tax=Arachis hypogaea TaxID=3818 RepID=A0A445D055_ARAHY|nr:hypothetical protein Ahy_A05g022231 isoform C [Arachis hypogaea]